MTNYGVSVTAIDWRPSLVPVGTGPFVDVSEEKVEPIIIKNTKRIDAVIESGIQSKLQIIPFLSSIGVMPQKSLLDEWFPKLLGSVLISTVLSAWISNALLMQIFVVLTIIDFVVKLTSEKETSFKQKVAYLVNNFLLIGIVASIAHILFKEIPFPFGFKFSILFLSVWFMNINYLYSLGIKAYSFSILKNAYLPTAFIVSAKEAIEYFGERFNKRLTKKL